MKHGSIATAHKAKKFRSSIMFDSVVSHIFLLSSSPVPRHHTHHSTTMNTFHQNSPSDWQIFLFQQTEAKISESSVPENCQGVKTLPCLSAEFRETGGYLTPTRSSAPFNWGVELVKTAASSAVQQSTENCFHCHQLRNVSCIVCSL